MQNNGQGDGGNLSQVGFGRIFQSHAQFTFLVSILLFLIGKKSTLFISSYKRKKIMEKKYSLAILVTAFATKNWLSRLSYGSAKDSTEFGHLSLKNQTDFEQSSKMAAYVPHRKPS